MKSIHKLCLALLLPAWGLSQNKIELYDLISAMAPDSVNTSSIVKWNTTDRLNNIVSWQSQQPSVQNGTYSKRGTVAVMINGKTLQCDAKNNPCAVRLYLEGTKNGYSTFSLDHDLTKHFTPVQSLDFLFNRPVKFNVYKNNVDTGKAQMYTYEIKMDGKQPIWLVYASFTSASGNGMYIKAYSTEEALKASDIIKPAMATAKSVGKIPPVAVRNENPNSNRAATNTLDFLIEYNASQKDIFSNKSFVSRLKQMLGRDYNRMMANWDLATPIVIEKGLFYYWGMQSHNGGVNESMILADINKNTLYVNLLKDEKPYYFSEDGKNVIPPYLLNWGKEVSERGKAK